MLLIINILYWSSRLFLGIFWLLWTRSVMWKLTCLDCQQIRFETDTTPKKCLDPIHHGMRTNLSSSEYVFIFELFNLLSTDRLTVKWWDICWWSWYVQICMHTISTIEYSKIRSSQLKIWSNWVCDFFNMLCFSVFGMLEWLMLLSYLLYCYVHCGCIFVMCVYIYIYTFRFYFQRWHCCMWQWVMKTRS